MCCTPHLLPQLQCRQGGAAQRRPWISPSPRKWPSSWPSSSPASSLSRRPHVPLQQELGAHPSGALQLGYWLHVDVLNAADFGVPQTRRRLVVRAVRGGFVPHLPPKIAWRGWYDAIADLIPRPARIEVCPNGSSSDYRKPSPRCLFRRRPLHQCGRKAGGDVRGGTSPR
jgi:hypothetical protein